MDEHEGVPFRSDVATAMATPAVADLLRENERLKDQLAAFQTLRSLPSTVVVSLPSSEFAARFLLDLVLRYADFYGPQFVHLLVGLLHDKYGVPSGPPDPVPVPTEPADAPS
jgi:hypothetical protein